LFLDILHTIPVVVVDSRKEVDEVKELLGIAKEYALALRIELKRKEPALKDDSQRQSELSAYFTHCQLQPTHLKLSLQSAMSICFKAKNYNTAASIARRLLELNLSPTVARQARQVRPRSIVQMETFIITLVGVKSTSTLVFSPLMCYFNFNDLFSCAGLASV